MLHGNGILIPAAEQYKKENLALNQQIELLLNDDVQDVQIEEIDEVELLEFSK